MKTTSITRYIEELYPYIIGALEESISSKVLYEIVEVDNLEEIVIDIIKLAIKNKENNYG